MAGVEKKNAAAGAAARGESDIAQWGLGDSLTVVVPDELVSEFVGILAKGEPSSLCDVMSANGITINFRPERNWSFDGDAGAGWIQLRFDRQDDPSDCHVLALNISRAKARDVGSGLNGHVPVLVPLVMNYLDEGVEAIAEVPVYFTPESA